jgi:hypothetical protein
LARERETYKKFAYWLHESSLGQLSDALAAKGIKIREAKGIVCTPLDPINKISVVSPGVWSETCKRPGSWYRASDKKNLYLVVSSFELSDFEDRLCSIITESDFIPDHLASLEEKLALVSDTVYQALAPGQWSEVDEVEKRLYIRWAKRLGSDLDDYELLFLTQSANHANFVSPQIYLENEKGIIPYSIDCSAHLCSCCLEIFQVIGEKFKEKLVAPCPGATIFARLKRNRYLLVTKPASKSRGG